jgi:hypothetical protein
MRMMFRYPVVEFISSCFGRLPGDDDDLAVLINLDSRNLKARRPRGFNRPHNITLSKHTPSTHT